MATTSPSLAILRDNVNQAAKEIRRLHAENTQLSESLRSLWSKTSPDDMADGASISFSEDRDELKERLERYIAIIDRHLQEPVG